MLSAAEITAAPAALTENVKKRVAQARSSRSIGSHNARANRRLWHAAAAAGAVSRTRQVGGDDRSLAAMIGFRFGRNSEAGRAPCAWKAEAASTRVPYRSRGG
jgi:hypothetical protein